MYPTRHFRQLGSLPHFPRRIFVLTRRILYMRMRCNCALADMPRHAHILHAAVFSTSAPALPRTCIHAHACPLISPSFRAHSMHATQQHPLQRYFHGLLLPLGWHALWLLISSNGLLASFISKQNQTHFFCTRGSVLPLPLFSASTCLRHHHTANALYSPPGSRSYYAL